MFTSLGFMEVTVFGPAAFLVMPVVHLRDCTSAFPLRDCILCGFSRDRFGCAYCDARRAHARRFRVPVATHSNTMPPRCSSVGQTLHT